MDSQRRFLLSHFFVLCLSGLLSLTNLDALALELSRGADVDPLKLRLRTRVEVFKGSGQWEEANVDAELKPQETAIIICDMWDRHWCAGATRRVGILAEKINPLLVRARSKGIQIIHAPSDTMEYYRDYPQRRRLAEIEKIQPIQGLGLKDPPLPIDDSDGGCDSPGDTPHKAWMREHPAIDIVFEDVISDNGLEIYSLLRQKGIKVVMICGVHTNMCVLGRSFAIRQMVNWGMRCILIRDLTDAMYDPKDRPYVSHLQGTELVIEHIEKYWCPSTTSVDLMATLESK
jgi:nicotinamidase-related amidase